MGWFIVRLFIHDESSGTPWQALFWVGMVACLGLGAFYAIVWATGTGPAAEHAIRGLIGCATGLGAILVARALVWTLLTIFEA
jgi:hypothetical protein